MSDEALEKEADKAISNVQQARTPDPGSYVAGPQPQRPGFDQLWKLQRRHSEEGGLGIVIACPVMYSDLPCDALLRRIFCGFTSVGTA